MGGTVVGEFVCFHLLFIIQFYLFRSRTGERESGKWFEEEIAEGGFNSGIKI